MSALGGHKSLYSTVHYAREEFWRALQRRRLRAVKQAYDPAGRLPDLYDKCVLSANEVSTSSMATG